MKTLVIHPKDASTDFLKLIYKDKDWTLIDSRLPKSQLKKAIKEHDRIVMLGHGTHLGLYEPETFLPIIDSTLVYLLREKLSVAIWCNANVFFEKYELKGFYTGMIISEYEEALYECVNTTYHEIDESNLLFARAIQKAIDADDMLATAQEAYVTDGLNRTMAFNEKNLFTR